MGVREAEGAERELLDRLRAGDEDAFRTVVGAHHNAMRRLALTYVHSSAVADEVVQETWLAVIRGLDGFEGRASLKTWIFRILVHRARTRGAREARTVAFSSLGPADGDDGPTVDSGRFIKAGEPLAGWWSVPPSELPEDRLLAAETTELVDRAISALPARQQRVIRLRDVEGLDAGAVCESLGISAGNQRVLLHRARAAVRAALESHFEMVSV